MHHIENADCLDFLAAMNPECVDSFVEDPPYGLAFMGKGWDHAVPGPEYFAAQLRVAKPGAHLVAFGGTRTYHRLACAIEDAGWELRDCLMWLYGSGFPKSHNLKGEHAGMGTALKPAWEPIILARKPFKATVASNVGQHGTGALNIDGCRVGTEGGTAAVDFGETRGHMFGGGKGKPTNKIATLDAGRWPANVVLDPEAGVALMRWLTRLITPPGGLVCDPFCGSGSTGCAAVAEGFDFLGIEREPEFAALARARAGHAQP